MASRGAASDGGTRSGGSGPKAHPPSASIETRRAAVQAELTRLADAKRKILKLIEESDDLPSFIRGRATELDIQERRLRGELDTLARAGQESAETVVEQVRHKVEGMRKMLEAPVAQARSALRRLGVKVTLTQEALWPGTANFHFKIAGTWAGMVEGGRVLVPVEDDPEGAPGTPSEPSDGVCSQGRTPTGLRPPDFESVQAKSAGRRR